MIKKIFFIFIVFLSFFIWNHISWNNYLNVVLWSDDILSKDFEIDTSLFSVWWNSLKWSDSKTTINNTLWNIIKKLMIALWVISLFIMTIWVWYMILYHWQDEYLSKWKNIFIWWITALIVALSSYYLVNFIWYILYN